MAVGALSRVTAVSLPEEHDGSLRADVERARTEDASARMRGVDRADDGPAVHDEPVDLHRAAVVEAQTRSRVEFHFDLAIDIRRWEFADRRDRDGVEELYPRCGSLHRRPLKDAQDQADRLPRGVLQDRKDAHRDSLGLER